VRDPAVTIIALPLEKNKHHYSDGFASLLRRTRLRFAPIADDLLNVFCGPKREQVA
jgi:5,5'-dehydrodivanillate O-demethylase